MQIWGSCRSAGLGGDKDTALKGAEKYRDGSKEYYLLGYDVPMVKQSEGITEGKVLGGFIMAATEYERAYQNQDSKQILFARDLAPNYDFSTTAGPLDATAYGDGTVSYQWYKDNAKIADATSATYAPTESGSYYCIATANDKTITTSTTTVTAKSANTGGETTSANVTFVKDKLQTLDSNPATGNTETKVLTIDKITISAGTGINASSDGIKVSKSNKSSFKISAENAKITKIIVTQKDANRELNYSPLANGKSNANNIFTYDYSTAKPSEIEVNYNTSGNIYVSNIQVFYETTGSTTPATDLTATYAEGTSSVVAKEVALTTPKLTVKAGGNTLEEGTDYRVTYASSNTNAVSVSADGKTLTSVNKGESATITATITPVDKSKYNATIAQFTISVTGRQLVPAFSSASVSANEGDEARVLDRKSVV